MNSLERAHSSCAMAQRLNNKAAAEIESGDYDQANKTLNHALRLSRVDFREPQVAHILILEACITHSQSTSVASAEASSAPSTPVIYQQPLRVPPQYMSQPMGRVLQLLIMYNMALAHQLKYTKETSPEEKRTVLNRALKLYELAYQWQNHNKEQEQNKSLRFNMILINNIGDIHRCVNNKQKFQRCMQQLSRNMMYVHLAAANGNRNYSNAIMIPMQEVFRRNISMSRTAGAA